ncbi:hypothetical protein [Streptomyces sp. NRRL F-5135]|uniref:hypothetical protein n=1 Tax=Streptomyces sp. NRRL F-5135 TaxID=1463858 RepID=UPI0004C73A31|nr:hypothetical protein [Streptomyces sp. NRRL F-5135]
MSTVIRKTREELERQRKELLESVHMSYTELRDRAAVYSLSMNELMIWHTIEGLDYLLEGES